MALSKPFSSLLFVAYLVVFILPSFCHAFGAGNIASIARVEGQNWRHGDIEDTFLQIFMAQVAGGKKFTKMDVKRIYFGNWLRDYSQAVDVGTVKKVPAEAIRILLWVLSFLTFGYGSKEFEVTRDRLGCYRPEEHIDNPKDYADNLDARVYDARLRGPVDEKIELAIDPRTGLKMYIASEDKGFTTSAALVKDLFRRSIFLGRQYARTRERADLYEALRLLGTGCHCLEDFSAHSNYTELAIRNCGEGDVFPHVGRNATVRVNGVNHPIFPVVTGTFGGVDFLHSVMGELDDRVDQSELTQLERSAETAQNPNNATLTKELLSQMPRSLFGGNSAAARVDQLQADTNATRMRNLQVTPRDSQAWAQLLDETIKQIYPILEFHDEVFQSINSVIEKIPILPGLIEKLQDQINIFVFSLIAPLILPVLQQVKAELCVGSSEIIKSSKEKQLLVFRDDHCSDPTHSMLSKDHFSNVLNEPAGKIASQVLRWVVPQLMACWDDEQMNVDRILNRIVSGVFHHPALREAGEDGARDCRQLMFEVVKKWWHDKTEPERRILRNQLSRDGVEKGRNHKDGVHDSGHGSCKPLGKANSNISSNAGSTVASPSTASFSGLNSATTGSHRRPSFQDIQHFAGETVTGGALGGLFGGLVGKVGSGLLGSKLGGKHEETQTYHQQSYNSGSSFSTAYMNTAHHQPGYDIPAVYGQIQHQETTKPGASHYDGTHNLQQYSLEQNSSCSFPQGSPNRPDIGSELLQSAQNRHDIPGEQWQGQTFEEYLKSTGQHPFPDASHSGKKCHGGDPESDSGSDKVSDGVDSLEKKRRKKEKKRLEHEEQEERKDRRMREEEDRRKRRQNEEERRTERRKHEDEERRERHEREEQERREKREHRKEGEEERRHRQHE